MASTLALVTLDVLVAVAGNVTLAVALVADSAAWFAVIVVITTRGSVVVVSWSSWLPLLRAVAGNVSCLVAVVAGLTTEVTLGWVGALVAAVTWAA